MKGAEWLTIRLVNFLSLTEIYLLLEHIMKIKVMKLLNTNTWRKINKTAM